MLYKTSPSGGRMDNSWVVWTAAMDQRLETLWNKGRSLKQLAEDFKIGTSSVHRRVSYLRAQGISMQGRVKVSDQIAQAKALAELRKGKAPTPPPAPVLNGRHLYPLEAGHPISWSCLWADTSMAQEVPPWPTP